jgi:glycine betaine/proline transport system substrate-binding protein
MKHISSTRRALALAASGLAMASMVAAQDKETIQITEAGWAASSAIGQVMKIVIEERLGYPVEIVNGDEVVLLEALVQGDGAVDIMPDFWPTYFPGQWTAYVAEGSNKSALLNDRPYEGTDGLFVPTAISKQYGITSIDQLKDPAITALFDSDGDGKGDFWAGAPGWQNVEQLAVKARDLGFADNLTPLLLEVPIFEATLAQAMDEGKPILFYSYTPEWIHSVYDLTKLQEPPFDGYAADSWKGTPLYNADGCFKYVSSAESPTWMEDSKITCANGSTPVSVVRSATLAARAPEVDAFARQISFTTDQVNEMVAKISRDGIPAADVAAEFVASHADLIANEWLKDVAPAN